jgi:hypothetical protein
MRDLLRNKTNLWYVTRTGSTDKLDEDGNFTGEKIMTYSTPISISMNLYPANGSIVEAIFGKDASFDMVGVSNEIDLDKDALLFLSEPQSNNYDKIYDYRVDSIRKSLNTTQYGLRNRT